VTLIVDPMHEAVGDLAHIEEWLRWTDCDDDELGQLLDRAAERAGALAMALRVSLAATPALARPGLLRRDVARWGRAGTAELLA